MTPTTSAAHAAIINLLSDYLTDTPDLTAEDAAELRDMQRYHVGALRAAASERVTVVSEVVAVEAPEPVLTNCRTCANSKGDDDRVFCNISGLPACTAWREYNKPLGGLPAPTATGCPGYTPKATA